MKIAINATAAVAGGAVTYLHNVLPALAALDKENEYRVLLPSHQDETMFDLPSNFHLEPVSFPTPKRLRRLIWEQTILPTWLRKEKVDVLYAPMDIAPLLAPCSVVLAVRNPNPYYRSLKGQSVKFAFQKRLSQLSAHKAKKVIFVSGHSRDTIAPQLHIARDKATVVYHGLDHTMFNLQQDFSISESLRKRIKKSKPFVLCVSTVNPHKNYETLLRGWAKLEEILRREYKLIIAGRRSTPEYFEQLVALSKNLSIEDEVIFLGEVPYQEVPYLYSQATAFAFPSKLETFGHPLVEAMVMRVPIVAANSTCIPEIVEDSALLFEPESSEDLSLKMKRILTDSDLRETLIKKGQRRAQDFSWEKTARKTLDILEEAAGVPLNSVY